MPKRRRILEPGPVIVVLRVRDHAGPTIPLKLQRHGVAEQRRRSPDQRVVVQINRIGIGRHEEPRSVLLHLVHGEKYLRVPRRVEQPGEVPIFREVHHERIAVDVMTRVFVVEPRQWPTLEWCPFVSCVPVGDDPIAVRIERRNQNHDDVLKDVERRRIGGRGQHEEELAGRLGRANL